MVGAAGGGEVTGATAPVRAASWAFVAPAKDVRHYCREGETWASCNPALYRTSDLPACPPSRECCRKCWETWIEETQAAHLAAVEKARAAAHG